MIPLHRQDDVVHFFPELFADIFSFKVITIIFSYTWYVLLYDSKLVGNPLYHTCTQPDYELSCNRHYCFLLTP